MTNENTELARLIDLHLCSHTGFAIFRMPAAAEPIMLVQTSGSPRTVDSLCQVGLSRGFVMTPACCQKHLPCIVIAPDVVAKGHAQIVSTLQGLPTQSVSPLPSLATHNITRTDYELAIQRLTDLISTSPLQKVVFARSTEVSMPRSFATLFVRACQANPDLFVYLCYSPLCGTWIGSTPEILLRQHATTFMTMALAGTRPTSLTNEPWSPKNIAEQRYVHDYIASQIASITSSFTATEVTTRRAGAIEHLCSCFTFESSRNIGELAALLHPTPAVCGQPKDLALQALAAHEATHRLYYSGVVGHVGLDISCGNSLFVNLRCMMANKQCATLFAGGGILASSTIDDEWLETEMKMNTLRSLI